MRLDKAIPQGVFGIVREHFPPGETGTRVGAVIMFTMLGMALGGWMSGKVFDLSGTGRD